MALFGCEIVVVFATALRYALTGGGSLAESHVATGGYMLLLAVAGVRQALVAELLSLSAAGTLPEMNLSPQRKKEKTLEALLGLLEDLSRKRPVLMVFEDVHWIDPTSRELLDLTPLTTPRR